MGEAQEWALHRHANPMKICRKNSTQTEYMFGSSSDMARVFGIGIERGLVVIEKNQAQVNIFEMPSNRWQKDWERENVFTIDVEEFLILVSEKKKYFPSRSLDSIFETNVCVRGQGSSGAGLDSGGSRDSTFTEAGATGGAGGAGGPGGEGGAGGEDAGGGSGSGSGEGGSGDGRDLGFVGLTATTVTVRERKVEIRVHLFHDGVANLTNLTCPLDRFHMVPGLIFIFRQQDRQSKPSYNFSCETIFETSEVVAEHRIDDNTIRQRTLHDELMVEFGPNQSRIVGM